MTKVHSQNLARRLLVMLVAFAVVFTYIPQEAFAGTNNWRKGSKVYFVNGSVLKGKDNRPYGGYVSNISRHAYALKPMSGGKTVRGYCLQRDVMNPSNGSTKYTANDPNKFFSDMGSAKSRAISLALLYAKQPDYNYSDMESLLGVSRNVANYDDWWLAGQLIIWEFEQGLRKSLGSIPKNVSAKNLGTVACGGEPANFHFNIIKGRPAEKVYFAMLKAMRNHMVIPSFTSPTTRSVKSIYMEEASPGVWKAVNSKYANAMEDADREIARAKSDYYTLTDKDTCGHDLKVLKGTAKDSAYTFTQTSKGKYTLTYKGATLPSAAKHGKKNIPETTKDDLLVWQASGYQTIATGADDPVDFYFKMKPLRTMGENDIEFFPEVRFPVHKNDKNTGWDGSVHTGMGDASLGATFELYRGTELVDTVTLDAYGETDYLTDIPWQDPEDVPKAQSGTKTHMVDSQPHCTVTPTKTTWDDTTTYTIVEIPPAGRHAESPTVSRTYKVTYHAESANTQACMSEDQVWGPVNYKVDFNDNGTTKSVQGTIGSGSVTLDYVHDFEEQVFVNDNYRGLLEIVKTKDDLNPYTDGTNSDNGVKTESTKSKWTIQLKSGGYEESPYVRVVPLKSGEPDYDRLANNYKATRDDSGTPADENNPLEVNANGKIRITDLPYGTYLVKEIAADNNGYVLETFEVTISTDGQAISKKVNNKAKTNKIKVVKTNSETGKTVRWDADRTAFRIRYMGHSEYGDPTAVDNYNKLLPNSSAYTNDNGNYVFYANKNGEITLPYEIEYGHYLIEELVVPNGYYVGAYDQDGNGSIADMGSVKIVDHEGQAVTLPKSFAQTVQVRDADGNKVTEFTGNNKVTYNTYGFSVTEQDPHEDGNDYVTYYAVVEMANNPAKGKIEITKDGQGHVGWNMGSSGGHTLWSAFWDKIALNNAKFEIYAAEDILQSDGVIPIKAFDAKTDKQIDLTKVSRDHADISSADVTAKEVWQVDLKTGEAILQVSGKDKSKTNTTVTDYFVNATNGATYKDSFTVKDTDKKLTYKYDVEYTLNYSKGGFNYTDVHVTKQTVSDNYVPEIETTTPLLKSGDEELGYATMNYANGNMVRMNRLASEAALDDADVTGVYSDYDAVTANAVKPKVETVQVDDTTQPQNPDGTYPQKDEDQVTNAPKVPDTWDMVNADAWDADKAAGEECFMINKTEDGKTTYRILVAEDGEAAKWATCDEDGNFYKSYTQEYSFTTAQHYSADDGFTLNWDDAIIMETDVDHAKNIATTIINNHKNGKASVKTSDVYTSSTADGKTTFTGKPVDNAPVYFKTNDGIKTEMFLSGMLTHTKITLTQDQLYVFDRVLPAIYYDGAEVLWKETLTPDNPTFEEIVDDRNYVKAERYEVGKDNPTVYYTIDIVSNNADKDAGYKIVYPDTTEAKPLVTDGGKSAKLTFSSVDDTMVYPMGSPVETVTTNSKGVAESSALPLGTYWVREVASGNGHVNNGEWQKFTISYEDQYTPLIWKTANYKNEAVSVRIDLEKLFETAVDSGEYTLGSGAVFGIYTAEEITGTTASETKVDAKSVPADTLVGKMAVSNGQASATVKLPLGKYYIKELSAPYGYKLNGSKYYFDAVDVLIADEMNFAYKDLGITGTVSQTGNNGVVIDFDTKKGDPAGKVTIDGTVYAMDKSVNKGKVDVSVIGSRTNTQITLADGQSTTIKFENGGQMVVTAKGQTYTAVVSGTAMSTLETGADGNDNFAVSKDGGVTTIKYSPKVTKTTWLSEVTYKYVEPKEDATDAEKAKLTELKLTSPEGTSTVTAKVDYEYGKAILSYDKSTVTSITHDGSDVTPIGDTLTLERIVRTPPADPKDEPTVDVNATKAVISFADGVSYTVEFDKAGNFYMSASGAVDKNLDNESLLLVDGSDSYAKTVTIKHTKAKTYARNNTNAGVLNIRINGVTNDRIPTTPVTPPSITPPTPEIGTTALDSDTLDHISNADGKVTITDKVEYKNLIAEKEYTMNGVLMNKATGKPLLVDGKKVTASKTFTPDEPNGSVELAFTFNGSKLAGVTTVVFEELSCDGDVVAEHKDINDEGQTIHFPNLKTKAALISTGYISDTVSYSNLIIGKEYTVKGVLMDKATGKPILSDGEPIVAETTFVAKKTSGSVEVAFYFRQNDLLGKDVVVFEELYFKGKLVGSHKDINDKDQTVTIPEDEKPGGGDIPKTGDETNMIPYILMLLIASGAAAGFAGSRRFKKEEIEE